MKPTLDISLDDEVTVEEIRLVTELIVVAADAPATLEPDVIDRVLGLEAPHDAGFPSQRRSD
ncbi:MAG: hypothetical protein WB441_12405 [Nocardioidaceae bacterium]